MRDGADLARDCSGMVSAVYRREGIELPAADNPRPGRVTGVRAMYAGLLAQGRISGADATPAPGMLVFFDRTYDVDRDGHIGADDYLSHVGMVTQVRADGTVVFHHRGERGWRSAKMNLVHPHDRRLNDYVFKARRHLPGRLSAELFAGFGRVQLDARRPRVAGEGATTAEGRRGRP